MNAAGPSSRGMVLSQQQNSADGRVHAIARELLRGEIDAAYRAGRRSALEDSPSGLFALITGLVIGLVIASLVSWGISL